MTLNHNYGCFSGVGSGIAGNGWRYVVGLPCMDYRVTNTAYGKLKYTACCRYVKNTELKH